MVLGRRGVETYQKVLHVSALAVLVEQFHRFIRAQHNLAAKVVEMHSPNMQRAPPPLSEGKDDVDNHAEATSANPIRKVLREQRSRRILLRPLISQHPCIYPRVVSLNTQHSLRRLCVDDVVVVAVGTELVALLVISHVFPERLLALLAHEGHLRRLLQPVILCLRVAFGTVEPLLAARSADSDLGIQDVFTHISKLSHSEGSCGWRIETT